MEVMIGVDPHKASHHSVRGRRPRGRCRAGVGASVPKPGRAPAGVGAAVRAASVAIEGADGLGYLLSQQLVAAGEEVINVPATLATRTRVLGSGRSNNTVPIDARAVALTALRHHDLRQVHAVGQSEVLRRLAKRNTDIGDGRTQVVSRLHSLLVELAPGGRESAKVDASSVGSVQSSVWRPGSSTGCHVVRSSDQAATDCGCPPGLPIVHRLDQHRVAGDDDPIDSVGVRCEERVLDQRPGDSAIV